MNVVEGIDRLASLEERALASRARSRKQLADALWLVRRIRRDLQTSEKVIRDVRALFRDTVKEATR